MGHKPSGSFPACVCFTVFPVRDVLCAVTGLFKTRKSHGSPHGNIIEETLQRFSLCLCFHLCFCLCGPVGQIVPRIYILSVTQDSLFVRQAC